MTSALPIFRTNWGSPSPGTNSFGTQVVLDLCAVAAVIIMSVAAGLGVNRLSSQPLPLVYQTPEQRFDAELASMVALPPFEIPPAATLGLAQFRSAVERKSALILDARPSSFFLQGHVPGALNLARDDFAKDFRHLSGVLKASGNRPIIVYCSGGACHDSRMVANALLSLGFSNVSVFTGGWEAWSAAGLPISTGASG